MSEQIKATDVLAYLNELGYRNIEAHQLKAFIIDLKKLIKNDKYTYKDVDNANLLLHNYNRSLPHDTNTFTKSKTESVVTVEISKPKSSSISNYNSRDCSGNVSDYTSSESSRNSCKVKTTSKNRIINAPPPSVQSLHDSRANKRRKILSEGCISRPTSSFIRVKSAPLKPCRSDPVALYHYYQNQWKQTKIPGQDSHLDLRWTVREKLLGDHNIR